MKFNSLLKSVVQLIGGDSDDIESSVFRFVRDMANHRIRIFWDAAPWPETIQFSEGAVDSRTYFPPAGAEVISLYDKDPRSNNHAKKIPFTEDYDISGRVAARITEDRDSVFARLRINAPQFEGDPVTSGDGYRDGSFWKNSAEVDVPSRSVNYLVRAIYSDYLRSNNQPNEAAAEEASAEGVLTVELEKLYSRKGQTPRTKVLTYGQ